MMMIQSGKFLAAAKEQIERNNLTDLLKRKPDLEGFSIEVMANPLMIGTLLEIIRMDKGSVYSAVTRSSVSSANEIPRLSTLTSRTSLS